MINIIVSQITTLPYLDMVISETFRKYPLLAFLDRIALTDYKVPNSDLVIEKGTPIYVSMMGLHYDPRYFPNPEKYDPLGFTEEAKNTRRNFIYLSFGDFSRMWQKIYAFQYRFVSFNFLLAVTFNFTHDNFSLLFFVSGMPLGLMQSKLGVVQILKDHEVSPCEKTKIPIVLDPYALTMTALGGMYLNIRKTATTAG
ncbi:cytochrome P450 6k1-like [Bombus pascuorum]|uniref:cytochrome P450 6k1-like n=1 Tax=Bombus pascuorum TaxID=65598 RepID=UPI00298D795E|nr:cytochrome P450 6k1-like [Bombus pascuorum]